MNYPHQEDSLRPINPTRDMDAGARDVLNVRQVLPRTNSHLVLRGNRALTEATAREVQMYTIDPAADAEIEVAAAVPTATPTTPFWAQRGDVTTPVAAALPASFLTFQWNPANDSVTVYVNDGGTIRSVAIGTVV